MADGWGVVATLTSIVILTRNELEYTRRCVESVQRCTPEAYELVFVDNGSTDGTVEYLRSVTGAVVIENDSNMGFGGGCNQGIAVARGDRVMLLNNDTVVTAGWLAALNAGLDADSTRGIVGPRSNHVADAQRVADVGYDVETLDGLAGYAAARSERMGGMGFAMARVIGFCMLMRREVIDRIGGFDVRFGLGNFEDDDICLRAAVAGWTCWVCDDSFVHHFGSRTFAAEGIEYSASLGANWKRFQTKWRLGVLADGAGYLPGPVVARTTFDPAVHFSALVAGPHDHTTVDFERRGVAVLVAADRTQPLDTQAMMRAALQAFGPDDDVTVVIRVDPRDAETVRGLEAVADAIGDHLLPDIQLIERRDDNDEAVVRACDQVVCHGRSAYALRGVATLHGVATITLDQLAARPAQRAA